MIQYFSQHIAVLIMIGGGIGYVFLALGKALPPPGHYTETGGLYGVCYRTYQGVVPGVQSVVSHIPIPTLPGTMQVTQSKTTTVIPEQEVK